MPLNLDILGAGALAAALRNPAVSPRVTIEARSAGALVWSGHVAQVSQTGTTLRVRGYSETIAPTASADFVAIEYGSVSVRGGLSAGDFAILPATPLPGHFLEFILSVASASEPPILNDGEYAKKAKTSAEEAEDSASVALGAKQSAVAAATSAAEDATRAATAKTAAETQAARAKDYADAANGHISSMGKLLRVDAPQTLTGVEKNQALANLWPVYTGGDGTTSSADFTMAGLNLRWGAAENTSLDPYGVTAYRYNNRRERCALTAGGVTLYDPDGNASAYYAAGSAEFYNTNGVDFGRMDDYRTSHSSSGWSLDLNPMDGLYFMGAGSIALYGPTGASVGDAILNSGGIELTNNAGVAWIDVSTSTEIHHIRADSIGFFRATGITAPRPSASTTTLADVIALLTDLGFVQ